MAPKGSSQKPKQQKREHQSSSDESFNIYTQLDHEAVIKKAVSEALMEFKGEMLRALDDKLDAKLSQFRAELDIIGAENDVIRTNVAALSCELKQHSSDILDCKAKFEEVNKKLCNTIKSCNSNEQYSRRCSLRIHGVVKRDNENCKTEALNVIKNKLRLRDFGEADITVAHRVGKPHSGKPPALIVKFANVDRRNKVLGSRRVLKGSEYVITEDLTLLNQQLLNRVKLDPTVKFAWSWNGSIWYSKEDGVKRRLELFQTI